MQKETTITEAKIMMRKQLAEGGTCCVCQQHFQMYHRPITSAMVQGLIIFYKASKKMDNGHTFIHVEDMFKAANCSSSVRGDFSKLRFWEFIQPLENGDDAKRNSGFYKILQKGIDFVEGKTMVPAHVKIYNNTFYGYSDKMISVHDAIKNKFNYSKLLNQTL